MSLERPFRIRLCALLALAGALCEAPGDLALGQQPAAAQPTLCPSGPLTRDCRGEDFDYFVSGDPAAPRPRNTRFGIILMGGGGYVEGAYRAIAERAGLGHIVVLRATADHSFDPDDGKLGPLFLGAWGPAVSCQTFTFHGRAAAFDARVITTLRHADGVFLAGGDQSNYVRYWKATPVQATLNALVKRAPVGGSSAGLAILGHYSYTALDGGSLESKAAFADPLGPAVTLEDDLLHFRGLENVITDTHFSARSRLGRLIVFVARLDAGRPTRRVFGVGVDERTAVVAEADGTGRMVGGSEGSAWVVTLGAKTVLTPGLPFSATHIRIVQMARSSVLHLRSGVVERPASVRQVRIEAGTAIGDEPVKRMMLRERVPPGED